MDGYRSFREAGVSASLLNSFFTEWEKVKEKVQFHSMVLLRHGKHVMTADFSPYDSTTAHMLFSLSKSFTSAAAGFAVSEGLLRWDTPVTDLLRGEIPEGREEELKQVTLESLLVMGSGLDEASDSPSPDPKVTWARHVLSFSVKYPPMTHFHYNTFGTYLISCMVEKAAGQSLTDYLAPRLFDKLGIEKPVWEKSPEGVCCVGFGLYLSAENISRFGQCLLDGGRYNGEQVLPEGWTELATREHIANYTGAPEPGNEWAQGYGFQFWRCIGGRYRGDGAMGQLCLVDEAHDAVLAVTCGTGDMGEEYRLIREYLIPALDGALPDAVLSALRAALPILDGKLRGFADPDAVLTGVETRSSSPVRILREEDLQSAGMNGLYPCGEGAGYAGGITSAAVDGMKCAEKIIEKYR